LAGQPEDKEKGDQYVWEAKASSAPDPSLGLKGDIVEGSTGPAGLLTDGSTPGKGAGDSQGSGSANENDTGNTDSTAGPPSGPPQRGGGEAKATIIPFAYGRSQSLADEKVSSVG